MHILKRALAYNRFKQGWQASTTGALVWAVHPFEKDVPVGKKCEKTIRQRAKKFERETRRAEENEAALAAVAALTEYVAIAREYGEQAYVEIWTFKADECIAYLKRAGFFPGAA